MSTKVSVVKELAAVREALQAIAAWADGEDDETSPSDAKVITAMLTGLQRIAGQAKELDAWR